WSTGSTTAAITVNPATTTTYTVTVTNAAGCTASTGATVTVNALPTPSIAPASASICDGESTTLIASGGTGYNWSTGATTSAITINPATTTTYTVTVTNAAGCTASTSATVTVNALPTPSISPASASICVGENTTLTASGGTGYNWSTVATTAAITVNPPTTTTYTVTVTNAAGCTASTSATVTVNSLPTASITPVSASICVGESTTLKASGGTGYTWSTGATTAAITVNPATTTTYTVTVTNAAGCTASTGATVTVNPLPIVNAGTDVSIPFGTSTTLTGSAVGGSGFYNYSWDPAALVVNSTLSTTNTVNLNTTTVFTLTATDQVTGCMGSDQVTVTVTGGPLSVDASATDTEICFGSSTQLNAIASGGSGTYSFTWSSTPAGFNSNLQNPIVNPTTTTTYSVTVSDGFNTASSSITITVNPLPVANAGDDQVICEGNSATLVASGGDSYLWITSETTASIVVSPAVTTTYTVTVSTVNGCTATDDVTVTVNPTPVVNAGNDVIVCENVLVTLNATGAPTLTWDNGVENNVPFFPPLGATVYTVVGINAFGCNSSDQVTVTVNPNPVANAGDDVQICFGESINLTATGGETYSWSTGDNTATITVSPVNTLAYTVTVYNAYGCQATDNVTVIVNPLPVADAGADETICEGGVVTLIATGGVDYLWSTNENTQSITVAPFATTTYQVSVTNEYNCSAVDFVTVFVNEIPDVQLVVTNAQCGSSDGAIEAVVTGGSGTYIYTWDENTGYQTGPIASNLGAGIYSITVNDGNCPVVESAEVIEADQPVVFINASSTVICEGESVTLTASGADSYVWTPDTYLDTNNGETVVSTPAQSISYTVVGYSGNCSATSSVDIIVNSYPVAYFVYNDLGMGQFEFSDLSLNAESYFWDFGDGTNANVQNPVHIYTEEGEYNVSLTVTNSCGTSTYDVIINVVITNIVINNSNVALMVYPNPNNGLFNIRLEGNYTGKIYLEVFDLAGRKIMIDEWNKETSEFNIPMDFTTLARGVYNLRVIVGDDVINTNVIFR
ncbi:MAG: PKD domain-containing protein, partial [Bacteroidales bacterium]